MPGVASSQPSPSGTTGQIVRRRFPAPVKRRDQRLRVRLVVQPQVAARLRGWLHVQHSRVVGNQHGIVADGVIERRNAHLQRQRKSLLQRAQPGRTRVEPDGIVDQQSRPCAAVGKQEFGEQINDLCSRKIEDRKVGVQAQHAAGGRFDRVQDSGVRLSARSDQRALRRRRARGFG